MGLSKKLGIRNVTFTLKDDEALSRQKLKQIGETQWENVCRRVEEIEQHYWEKDGMVEERIIIEDNRRESSEEEKEVEEDLEKDPLEDEDVVLSCVEEIKEDDKFKYTISFCSDKSDSVRPRGASG